MGRRDGEPSGPAGPSSRCATEAAASRPRTCRIIFDPFYRGRQVKEAQIQGSGLGLSLARDAARAAGGDLDGRQPARRGQRLHAMAAESGRSGRLGRRRREERGRMKPRVLLVEDEAGLRMTLSDRLASEGYEVETASDGPSGEAMAAGGAYDVILLDIMLPGKNGLDICRDLRAKGLTTPVMMLTAKGTDHRQGARTQNRRRRLPHQAVRDRRAARAHRGAATPRAQG